MAVYNTDLQLITDAESGGTWGELDTTYDQGGVASADEENFIQGADCYSQSTGNKSGVGFSILFDYTADLSGSFTDGVTCVFMWQYFAVGTNLYSYASDGMQMVVASDVSNGSLYTVTGNDFRPNPYGGWYNYAVDPSITADQTTGSGNLGTYRWFGSAVSLTLKISKGTPHAVDAMRYGRGEIYCTGADATFVGMAAANDDNSDPFNRWGLFQDKGGTYLWKGLMSMGQAGTSTTFEDSNRVITIDDTPKTFPTFNKIEINHVDSNVTWNNITFISTGTYAPGLLEVIDDATFVLTSCIFNDMNTFIFDSNSILTTTVFNGCGEVTQGAGTFDTCTFNESPATVTLVADNLHTGVSDCIFNSDGTGHAINIGSIPATTAITCANFFNGYVAGATGSPITPGTSGNEAILCNVAGGETLTINVSEGYDTPSVKNDGAGAVWVVSSVDVTLTVKDVAGDEIVGAQCGIFATDDNEEILNDTTDGAGVVTTGYGGTKPREVKVWVRRASSGTTRYKNYSAVTNISTSGLSLDITMVVDPNNNATS